ncbi:TetR/AcrR family transcriptional regulator [Secundilactobacillus paracollinoides]|uniref:TetR/AcrR family transcriptional regulator n=1 Tax=Secundilactobacillus paracollinoides TaxID=240427 RepID=UPI0006CFDEDF|nr:TetR/AcrR family transcriptional regulator [Secundilactobacillus paracollinoides]KRL78415.1 hypothetical protein FC17_GL001003 [Secundilactobacillus paracollinoides DSM 15502 = JCM 11969]
MDRRIIKTKTKLRDALFTLLADKPLTKITVAELCRTAQIDRRTFYIHYEKVADIFEDFSDQLFTEVDHALTHNYDTPEALLAVFDRILMSNFTGFKLLCLNQQHRPLVDQLQQMLFQALCGELLGNRPDGASQIVLQQLTAGLLNAYVYWFNHPDTVSYEELSTINEHVVRANLALISRH